MSIFRGGWWTSSASMVVRVTSTGLGYLGSVILVRILGVDSFGVFSFAIAVASLLAIPGQYGVATLVMRETASYSREENWSVVKGLWIWATGSTFVVSATIVIAVVALMLTFASSIDDSYFWPVLICLPLVVLLGLLGCAGASLRGIGRYITGQIPELLIRPALFVAAILILDAFFRERGSLTNVNVVIVIHIAAVFAALLLSRLLLAFFRPQSVRLAEAEYKAKSWSAAVGPLIAITSVHFLVNYSDIIMLGFLAQSREVGIYRVVSQTSIFVAFFLQAINAIVAPQFAQAANKNDVRKLQAIVDWSAKLALVLTIPLAFALVFLASPFLRTVFGAEYAAGASPLIILVLGQLGNVAAGSVTMLLSMAGHEKIAASTLVVFAAANIILNAILIPIYGLIGAASATAICLVSSNFYLRIVVREKIGVESSALFRMRTS